jgi:nucleoside-diphosphate-sugar epimerase
MQSQQTILVTGGAGFIGAHLVGRLLSRGDCVYVLDACPANTASPLRMLGWHDRVHYFERDVRDLAASRAADWPMFDVVFHLAAQPISPLSGLDPRETLSVNVDGTESTLSLVHTTRSRAFVLASSACVYGLPDPADCPLREDTQLRPGVYPYTESKQQAEATVRHSGVVAGIVRLVNVYGPSDWHASRLVPRTIRSLLCGEPLRLRRSAGESVLDFMYVDDAVDALIAVAEHIGRVDRTDPDVPTFNFGTSEPVLVRKFVEHLSREYDGVERLVALPDGPVEPAMSKYLCADHARRKLNWQHRTSRSEGVHKTIEWYAQHAHTLAWQSDTEVPAFLCAHHHTAHLAAKAANETPRLATS